MMISKLLRAEVLETNMMNPSLRNPLQYLHILLNMNMATWEIGSMLHMFSKSTSTFWKGTKAKQSCGLFVPGLVGSSDWPWKTVLAWQAITGWASPCGPRPITAVRHRPRRKIGMATEEGTRN